MASASSPPPSVTADSQQRQQAVQNFMARAELSKLTRALRARLSYAGYKATHNVSHLSLPVLEDRLRKSTPSSPRSSQKSPKLGPTDAGTAANKKRPRTPTPMAPPAQQQQSLYETLLGIERFKPAEIPLSPHRPRKKTKSNVSNMSSGSEEDTRAAATLASFLASPRSSFSEPQTNSQQSSQQSQPRPTTPDTDAAEIMLYFATSPSPARPKKSAGSAKQRDRASIGQSRQPQPPSRVLFPTSPASRPAHSTKSSSQLHNVNSLAPPPSGRQQYSFGDFIHVSPGPTPQSMSAGS